MCASCMRPTCPPWSMVPLYRVQTRLVSTARRLCAHSHSHLTARPRSRFCRCHSHIACSDHPHAARTPQTPRPTSNGWDQQRNTRVCARAHSRARVRTTIHARVPRPRDHPLPWYLCPFARSRALAVSPARVCPTPRRGRRRHHAAPKAFARGDHRSRESPPPASPGGARHARTRAHGAAHGPTHGPAHHHQLTSAGEPPSSMPPISWPVDAMRWRPP